jgi:hypothetical protein
MTTNKRISQAEARAAIKRCRDLEAKLTAMNRSLLEIPEGSVPIARTESAPDGSNALLPALVRNSQQFGHAVLVTVDPDGSLVYYALKRGDEI